LPFVTRNLFVKLAAVGVCGATLLGCRDRSGALPDSQVTYTRSVAPILFAHCASCHHPGGVAPFSVLDYEAVRTHVQQIVAATESRRMPPWLPEPGYGEFAGERRLTDQQIDTIRRWAASGSTRAPTWCSSFT
jgi:mono/diheme cytochrome c family protein